MKAPATKEHNWMRSFRDSFRNHPKTSVGKGRSSSCSLDEASPARRRVGLLLDAPMFEYTMGLIIVFNMFVIIVETDKSAQDEDSSADSKGALSWTDIVGWIILITFIVELLLRIFVERSFFWRESWNRFDFIVVAIDAIISFASLVLGGMLNVSTLRVFRLCKLARASKVFRVFPELRLMVAGLLGSIRAIFWGTGLLAFVLIVWAIVAVQLVHPISKEVYEKGLYGECGRCSRAYSTVAQATLTFSQSIVAGDSWGLATIPLIEYQPMTAVYFMGVFLSVGMAVLNLILGVVVNVAQKESDNLKEEMINEQRFEKMEVQRHLLEICIEMDTDNSGELSKEEIINGFHERTDFRDSVVRMDLEEDDLEILWTILDTDHSGKVSYNEFVAQVYKMRSSDTQFMLAYIKYYITIIKDTIVKQIQQNRNAMQNATDLIEKELLCIEKTEYEGQEAVKLATNRLEDSLNLYERRNRTRANFPLLEEGASEDTGLFTNDSQQKPRPHLNSNPEIIPVKDSVQAVEAKEVRGWQAVENAMQKGEIFSLSDKELQAWREIMREARQLQIDLRHTMQDIQHSHELHLSNASKMLSDLLPQRSGRGLKVVPKPTSWSIPLCCKPVTPAKTLVFDAHDDDSEPSSKSFTFEHTAIGNASAMHAV